MTWRSNRAICSQGSERRYLKGRGHATLCALGAGHLLVTSGDSRLRLFDGYTLICKLKGPSLGCTIKCFEFTENPLRHVRTSNCPHVLHVLCNHVLTRPSAISLVQNCRMLCLLVLYVLCDVPLLDLFIGDQP